MLFAYALATGLPGARWGWLAPALIVLRGITYVLLALFPTSPGPGVSTLPAAGHWARFADLTGASTADTVHVGASQYHDMLPAAALGYRTVFIDQHGEPLTTTPTHVLRDLGGLPRAIADLE